MTQELGHIPMGRGSLSQLGNLSYLLLKLPCSALRRFLSGHFSIYSKVRVSLVFCATDKGMLY